jgi:hypothetical protein
VWLAAHEFLCRLPGGGGRGKNFGLGPTINAYRMTDKVNIPDLKQKLQKRIDMILATARELSNLNIAHSSLD